MVVRILIWLAIFLFLISLTIAAVLADDSASSSHIDLNLQASSEDTVRSREQERVRDLVALVQSRTFLRRLAPIEDVMGEMDANRTREIERRFRREEEEGERALLAAVRLGFVRDEEEEQEQEEDERSPLWRASGWQERRGYGYGAIGAIGAMRTSYGVQVRSG
jgi:hypothetical protein